MDLKSLPHVCFLKIHGDRPGFTRGRLSGLTSSDGDVRCPLFYIPFSFSSLSTGEDFLKAFRRGFLSSRVRIFALFFVLLYKSLPLRFPPFSHPCNGFAPLQLSILSTDLVLGVRFVLNLFVLGFLNSFSSLLLLALNFLLLFLVRIARI